MKRRWFQIHLSTAIVLTFVSGGLLLLNLRPDLRLSAERNKYASYGWPMALMTRNGEGVICFRCSENEYCDPMRTSAFLRYAALDFIACTSGLLFVLVLCEYLTRHREARKP
jgi:hypothetical protein